MKAGEKVAAGFIGVLCLGAAIGAGVYTVNGLATGSATHEWPTVSGEVTESRTRGGQRRRRHVFTYVYQVERTWYEARRIGYFHGIWGPSTTRGNVAQYPVGRRVTVYYDPEDPARAVLEPGIWWAGMAVSIGVTVLFAGITLMILRAMLSSPERRR